ncbi:MAG: hypothetical protein HY820_33250 [Acidobacteria bacterium]|nr:hypothetical protein [Acidobacteriota bacterium]
MRNTTLATITVLLSGAFSPAGATLISSDFLTPGDGLLIFDTATNLQWLTPVYTKNHLFNDAFVQNINTTYGFRYATATETVSMVNSNFGNPTTVSPGDAAGFIAATNFMALFGVAQNMTCGTLPCPRTQGLTSDIGAPGNHLGFGLITLGSTGWFITNNAWPDTIADSQMGSFLVRDAASTPESATTALTGAGLLSLLAFRMRRLA